MLKPKTEDISTIINKLNELKKYVKRLNGLLLDPTELKALEAAERGEVFEYVLNLLDNEEKKNLLELIDGSRNIPGFKFGEYEGRSFAFSNESAIKGLTEKNKNEQKNFQVTHIDPLVHEIDMLLFPFWDYLKANGSWSAGEQIFIEAATRSNKQCELDKVIRELEKVRHKIEVEAKQQQERVGQGQNIIRVGETSKAISKRFLDRARQLIEAQFSKQQGFLSKEIIRLMQKANKMGMFQSTCTAQNVHAACEQEIRTKAKIVWDCIRRAHGAAGSPITESLRFDLKEETSNYIAEITIEISEVLTSRLRVIKGIVQEHHLDLESTKSSVTKEIDVEVDLYVDQLVCEKVLQNRSDRRTKTKKKKKVRVKKLERRYKPWKNPPDVCFVIVYTTEGDWTKGIHFYQDDKHGNLRLRSGSRVETLLTQLKDAYLVPEEIKASIGKDQTKASDIVTYANKLLNEKIRGMDFTRLPSHQVAFVLLQIGRYECAIPIYTKKEFDQKEFDQVTS